MVTGNHRQQNWRGFTLSLQKPLNIFLNALFQATSTDLASEVFRFHISYSEEDSMFSQGVQLTFCLS